MEEEGGIEEREFVCLHGLCSNVAMGDNVWVYH